MRNFFRTLAPEQFDAQVTVHADGSYAYTYDGVLIFVPALIQACRAGFLEEPHAPEYLLFGAVRPWTAADCLLAARTCAFVVSLTGFENELTFDAVRGHLNDDAVTRRLYPDAPWDAAPPSYAGSGRDRDTPEPPIHGSGGGSNNWAVSPGRSASGAALVANDPHVPLLPLPTFWHHVHLECPRYRVQGGLLPGCPVFGFGHNGALAWGVTTGFRDAYDLYRIHRLPTDPTRYRTPDGSAAITRHRETHATRRRGRTVELEWESCPHGILYPGWRHHDGVELAVRHVSSDLATYFHGYLALIEAQTVDAHRAALEQINEGPFDFNQVYGHRDGHIGWELFGHLPRRAADGLFVRDAHDPAAQWDGYLPFADMPKMLNPPRGYVATANSNADPENFAQAFTLVHCEPRYRQRQIEAFLAAREAHSSDTFAALQRNVRSDYGVPLRDAMLRLLGSSVPTDGLAGRAQRLFAEWNGAFDVDAPAATLFFFTQQELVHRAFNALLGDKLGARFANGRRSLPRLHKMLLDDADPLRADIERTSGMQLGALVRESFVAAVDSIAAAHGGTPEQWRWGNIHRARLGTVLSVLPFVGRKFLALNEGFPGDDYTVSPSRPLPFRGHLYAFVGASSRFICDLSTPEEAWFAHNSGPSGDIASPFFSNLTPAWHRFEYFRSALWPADQVPEKVEHVVVG